jgi:glycosyltransferase involved in cell wall biosynthesis
VEELFYKADGMCLPSLYEGLPMTLLESIAVGCIPICSPVGGIVNVITNGENGVLSKSSSEEDYYYAMKSFLSKSDDEIIKMKEAAKASFKDYDICKTAQEYLNVYNQVLNYRQL